MQGWMKKNKTPLLQSSFVLLMLVIVVSTLVSMTDFSHMDLRGLLFLVSLICCFLIAKNVFDTARESQMVEKLDEHMRLNDSLMSRALYLELYRKSPVPYLVIDQEGVVESANMAAARLLGISQTKITGIHIFEALKSEKIEHLDFLRERFKSGVPFSDEKVEVLREDNKETWAIMSLFPIVNVPGLPVGLLTLVDITKQKKIEDAKTQFVSLASHQLRTPIAGMKWSAELLQMDGAKSLTERQQKYVNRLLLSVHRMAVLVDDFLRVSRFELGTFVPEFSLFPVNELFDDVLLEQAARVEQKELVVKTFYDESVAVMGSDKNLVRMIVTNIFSNAVKYTREKGTIHIGYKKHNDVLEISIVDNGIGIPVGDQEKIFTKLFRAENATRDVPDGTGLGLYIVKEAVEVLKGKITFTSGQNVGTTFTVILPLEEPVSKIIPPLAA